jgi:hypothetical protein
MATSYLLQQEQNEQKPESASRKATASLLSAVGQLMEILEKYELTLNLDLKGNEA